MLQASAGLLKACSLKQGGSDFAEVNPVDLRTVLGHISRTRHQLAKPLGAVLQEPTQMHMLALSLLQEDNLQACLRPLQLHSSPQASMRRGLSKRLLVAWRVSATQWISKIQCPASSAKC